MYMLTKKRDTIVHSNIFDFDSRLRKTMTHSQRLLSYVNSLVLDNAERNTDGWYLSFNDLSDDEQGTLVALKLEEDDRDTFDCFHEADQYAINDAITSSFLKFLKNSSSDNRFDFAEAVRINSINRYRSKLQDLINDRCGWERQHSIDNKGYDE